MVSAYPKCVYSFHSLIHQEHHSLGKQKPTRSREKISKKTYETDRELGVA